MSDLYTTLVNTNGESFNDLTVQAAQPSQQLAPLQGAAG
jgi:hypothetical protein